MPLSIANLPFEILSEITRNVISRKDLCQLRSVNPIFSTLVAPAIFNTITVYNNEQSSERFGPCFTHLTLLDMFDLFRSSKNMSWQKGKPKTVWKRLEAAFSILHLTPGLKMLDLYFDVHYDAVNTAYGFTAYSHQWDIFYALGSNRNHLPELQSLKFYGWLDAGKFSSLFDKEPIAWLTASLRHLSFSLPESCARMEKWESREMFWRQVVVRRLLQPAVNLESLTMTRSRQSREPQCLDVSQAQLATYPRLAALSLRNIVWKDGAIGAGDIVTPLPLEDFILRHSKTLKKLELHNCSITVGRISGRPRCYWADVYKRLANALTGLLELEVEYNAKKSEGPYVYSSLDYFPLGGLEGTGRDAVALEEFKAIVKNRGMGDGPGYRL